MLQALPIAIYATDVEGRITFYNEAAAKLWGIALTSELLNGVAHGSSIVRMPHFSHMASAPWRWP